MAQITRRGFLGGAAMLAVGPALGRRPVAGGVERPNVVVVTTDDQAVESMRVMPITAEVVGARGTTFTTSYATTPVCSPSRATMLSGQYAHNHGVLGNGLAYLHFDHTNALPVWLQAAGYATAHVGKYLNAYNDATVVPPGWDHWFAVVAPSSLRYYGYELSDDGVQRRAGYEPEDYQTDVLAARAVDLVGQLAAGGRPFFLWFAPIAPHGVDGDGNPPVPAPRHIGRFADEPLPTPPSFDEADVSDKPADIRRRPRLGPNGVADITMRYRARLESLLAEDEAVGAIVDALDGAGVLGSTVLLYTSDNGFFHGEHRIRTGKIELYEPSVRVPLLAAGPGFAAGATVDRPVANVDLATTVVAMTGATPGRLLDGVDLRESASPLADPDRPILLETGPRDDPGWYSAVRTPRWLYAEHDTGEQELYDLVADGDQMVSRHDDPRYAEVRHRLARARRRLAACAGPSCRS
ncbi:MAG TPA: sulfatase [Acidimicrobiales bacterium]|jgi:arylsulfatase A-like enzyme